MAQEENVKDIIDYTPEIMKVINDEEIAKLVMDDLYFPILKVLRKGPMTVKEIEEEYNKIAKTPKSDKTIYRYLKTLHNADLVKPAGQRVVFGKTATETLFSRTAYAFYLRNEQSEFWKTDEGKDFATNLGQLLAVSMGKKRCKLDKFIEFLTLLSTDRIDKLEEALHKGNPELLRGVSAYDWQHFTMFFNLGSFFIVILNDDTLIERLRACFE